MPYSAKWTCKQFDLKEQAGLTLNLNIPQDPAGDKLLRAAAEQKKAIVRGGERK